MTEPRVQILLATYNGERFLQEQLDSIERQTYQNWEVLARDDGSSDKTVEILKNFQAANPGKLILIEDQRGNSGSAGLNFIQIAELSSAPILTFADQDDIWHPQKLEKSVAAIQQLESQYGSQTPAMAYHDFSIIDEGGKRLLKSYDQSQGGKAAIQKPFPMPFSGFAHGFSITFNRALLDKTLPVPAGFKRGHDVLFAHVALEFGHVAFLPEQLAEYRRHQHNVTSTPVPQNQKLPSLFKKVADIKNAMAGAPTTLKNHQDRTHAFLHRYEEGMSPATRQRLHDFTHLEDLSALSRIMTIFRYSSPYFQTALIHALASRKESKATPEFTPTEEAAPTFHL